MREGSSKAAAASSGPVQTADRVAALRKLMSGYEGGALDA
jgi:hypothetical protein